MQFFGAVILQQPEIERRQIIADRRRVQAEQPQLAESGNYAGFAESAAVARSAAITSAVRL